ncbi:MAG: hypothetical protein IJX49_01425 [Clostridia bacterium]|nr:hypothetical protein [Clostridia bacterium]
MKPLQDDYARINSLLQADKALMSEACKALVLQDFGNKFNEYFDLIGLPRMEISYKSGVYTIELCFEADRIKKFNVLK